MILSTKVSFRQSYQ